MRNGGNPSRLEPMPDTVFRDLDALPVCDPNSAPVFWSEDPYMRDRALRMCGRCPLGPYGKNGNICLDFYESHPEITGGVWGGRWFGGGERDA